MGKLLRLPVSLKGWLKLVKYNMASGHAKFEFTSKLWIHSNVRRLNHSGVRLLMPRKLTCFDRYYSKDRIRQEIKRRRRRRKTSSPSSGELTLILELDIPERNSITYWHMLDSNGQHTSVHISTCVNTSVLRYPENFISNVPTT